MNNTRNILLLVFGLVAIIGGLFMLSNGVDKQPSTIDIPEGWEEYSTSSITFNHPPEAKIQTEAGGVKVQVIGEDSIENSEVTDGFTLFIKTKEKENESLSEVSTNMYNEDVEILESVQSPTSTHVGTKEAYSYSVISAMGGESVNLVIDNNENWITASYTVEDPNDNGYEDTVEKILKTLRTDK